METYTGSLERIILRVGIKKLKISIRKWSSRGRKSKLSGEIGRSSKLVCREIKISYGLVGAISRMKIRISEEDLVTDSRSDL